MTEKYEGLLPLTVEIGSFEGIFAQEVLDLSAYFGVSPVQLVRYGMCALKEVKDFSEETGTQCILSVTDSYGSLVSRLRPVADVVDII